VDFSFIFCYLRFGIFHRNLKVSSSIKLEAAARGGAARVKLNVAGTVNILNVEHRTPNIERPILLTLRFIDL
jgi:hypothetical protein